MRTRDNTMASPMYVQQEDDLCAINGKIAEKGRNEEKKIIHNTEVNNEKTGLKTTNTLKHKGSFSIIFRLV